ncbi:TIGR04028 family ABC transporter substrate-binding protein [Brachybacterium paraconglomeratum]|uniref:ABC transporter substrate-binding protein n=1 Tax=Brachybacterium paraconglomeratum TaxID=173362 RepID=UPI0031ED4CE0
MNDENRPAAQDPASQRLEEALARASSEDGRIRRRRVIGGGIAAVAVVGAASAWGLASRGGADAAASGSTPGGTAAGGATGSPVSGGTLIYLDAEASRSTQPQGAGTWQDSAYLENIADRLIWKDPATGELQPYIAESWEISADGLTYTFAIREGVTYSDGTVLDAASVARNLQWQAAGDEAKGIQPSTQWPQLEEISVAGSTVTVTLLEPYAEFLDVLSGWAAVLVADATIEAPLESQQQITGIIGSGPFTVESEKYGEKIVFVQRQGYDWAPPSLAHQGEARLERLEVHAVTDDTARLGTLRSGQADLIRYLQPADELQLAADPAFQVLSAQGIGATNHWQLRVSIPALQDVRVRQALQVGIDRASLVNDLYTENWAVARSVVTEDAFGFVDLSTQLTYDPAKAAALLDEAGFSDLDSEGYRRRDGERLSLVTVIDVYDSTAKPLYQLVQAQLKELGVELSLRDADYSQVSEAYAAPDVATVRSGWPYPATWATLRTQWAADGTDAFSLDGADPTLDELLTEQATATDPAERSALLAELQHHVIENAYVLPLLKDSQIFAAQSDVQDFSWSAEARPLFYATWLDRP